MTGVTLERFQQIPLTKKLTEEQVKGLLPRVEEVSLSRGEILFQQGSLVTSVFFVEKGKVAEVKQDRSGGQIVLRHAGQGEYLGRYALVTGNPLQISARAEKETTLLAIPFRFLQPLLFAHDDWRSWFLRTDVAARLRAVPLFIDSGDWDIYRLADAVEVQIYESGATIFEAGDEADSFYIVAQGQVIEAPPSQMHPEGDWPWYYGPGNCFGHDSLKRGQRWWTTAVARMPTRLFCIPGQTLNELLQDRAPDQPEDLELVDQVGGLRGESALGQPEDLEPVDQVEPPREDRAQEWSRHLERVDLVERLREIPHFAGLSGENLRLLTGYVCLEYRRPGDIVARQGEPATSMMLLDEGEAVVRLQVGRGQPRIVTYLRAQRRGAAPAARPGESEDNYFGAHALLADEMRGATVEVTQPSVWLVLHRDDFRRFLADAGLRPEDLKQVPQAGAQVSKPAPSAQDDLPLPYKVRRHWIVPVSHILPLALLMILVIILMAAEVTSDMPRGLQVLLLVGGIAALLFLAFGIAYRYADWWNDTYEVTTRVVIHTEKKLFLSEERYEIPLQQIQNVNIFVGVVGRLLDFGNVGIDTAAAKGQIDFTTIPEPAYVQDLIQQASAQARSGLQIEQRESIREQLEDQLYPERLKPSTPNSVMIQPEPPSTPPLPPRLARFRTLRGWFPRFEIWEDDRVIWRKHWINLLQRTGIQGLALLLALYLLLTFSLALVTASFGARPVELPPVSWLGFQGWLFMVVAVLGILAALWFIYQYVDWRNDIYIVSDDEVIDVERELAMFPFFFLFTENRRQASLDKVQYVDFRIPNPVAMVLNYGDVIVQTAGAEGTLDFEFVSNPRHVHDEVLRRLAAYQGRQRDREFQERWGDMPQWFETYRDILDQTDAQGG